jgi:hypothetical protein
MEDYGLVSSQTNEGRESYFFVTAGAGEGAAIVAT